MTSQVKNCKTELDKMPSEEVAKIINPGVAPREHIEPR